MSNEKLEAGLASHLTQELGCEYELKEPKNTKHYKPLETPAAYPLELNENLHICLWMKKANTNGRLPIGKKTKRVIFWFCWQQAAR